MRANLRIGRTPQLNAKPQFEALRVGLLAMPDRQEIEALWAPWVGATWADEPLEGSDTLEDITTKTFLPSVLETVRITFVVDGIDSIDVTHLLRHRGFTFSAQCTADRNLSYDPVVVKPSIWNHPEFKARTLKLAQEAKELYQDMIDSEEVSILDARTVLPKCMGTFYYVSANLRDIIEFVKQRKDEQIQPESDNIIALYLWAAIVERVPEFKNFINWDSPDMHYINSAKDGTSTNIYPPSAKNAPYLEGIRADYLYSKTRDKFASGRLYKEIEKEVRETYGF